MRVHMNDKRLPKGRTKWKEIDSLSEDELTRRAESDPDAPPLSEEEIAQMKRVPLVKLIRQKWELTQDEFAEAFGLSVATIRDWEQGRTEPDQSSESFLRVIAMRPEVVRSALREFSEKAEKA